MAKEYALTVKIPEFDEEAAYDHDRPISSLIRTQLVHLHLVENLKLDAKHRTNININDLHTEREASEYIQKVTAKLHAHGKAERRKAAGAKTKTPKKGLKKSAKASGRKHPAGKASKTSSATKKRKRLK